MGEDGHPSGSWTCPNDERATAVYQYTLRALVRNGWVLVELDDPPVRGDLWETENTSPMEVAVPGSTYSSVRGEGCPWWKALTPEENPPRDHAKMARDLCAGKKLEKIIPKVFVHPVDVMDFLWQHFREVFPVYDSGADTDAVLEAAFVIPTKREVSVEAMRDVVKRRHKALSLLAESYTALVLPAAERQRMDDEQWERTRGRLGMKR